MHPMFIDYWIDMPATIPEKMVFSALVRRELNFYFSWYLGDIPFTPEGERYRPDFILPDYHIIIEVFGTYWHTRPGMYEHDAVKAGLLLALGWKTYVLTDYQILIGVDAALMTIPELAYGNIHGNLHAVGDRPINPSAALRSRSRKWPKVEASRWHRRFRRAGVAKKWRGNEPIKKVPMPTGPMFTGSDTLDAPDWLNLFEFDPTGVTPSEIGTPRGMWKWYPGLWKVYIRRFVMLSGGTK
jgi:hypothetical protein